MRLLHAGDPDGGVDLLRRGAPTRTEIVDLLSGHLCRCTGYAPIVDAIEGGDVALERMNLARSLLAACERHPELEAFPGLSYGELLPRVRRLAGGPRGSSRGDRVAVVLETGSRPRSSTGRRSGRRGGRPALVAARRRDIGYCLEDCGARVVLRDGDPLPDGVEHPGALDRDERARAAALHAGRPAAQGRPRLHAR